VCATPQLQDSCICVSASFLVHAVLHMMLTLLQRACARIERTNGKLPKSGTIESFDLWEIEYDCDVDDRVGEFAQSTHHDTRCRQL
jgi:hypothetical protein